MDAATATDQNVAGGTPALQSGSSRPLVPVVAFILLLGFGFQGSRHLWQPDEGYNAAVTLEMLDSGNLLIQTLDHQIYLGKSPAYIWGTLPGVILFGRNEWGLRAFCALCFCLTCWIVGLLGSSLWSRREGILAALIYATMILPFGAANVARPDTPLVLATTAAFYCFWRSVMPEARHVGLWKVAMCAAFGLGVFMKATAALVPAAPMFCYLLTTRQTLRYFATLWVVPCVLIFALTGFSWYLYMARAVPAAGAYLWDSNVTGRLLTETYHHHPGFVEGLKIYIPALLGGTMPWLLVWIPLSTRIKSGNTGTQLAGLRANLKITLLLLWLLLPLIVYFAASSKLTLYVLPVFAPFALLTARALSEYLPAIFGSFQLSPRLWRGLAIWGLILLGVKLGASYYPNSKDEGAVWEAMRSKVPVDCKKIMVVDEDLDGLRLYSGRDIQRLAVSRDSGDPPFVALPLLEEELSKLRNEACAIVANKHLREKNRELIFELLPKANYQIEEFPLPYERKLFVCREKRQ